MEMAAILGLCLRAIFSQFASTCLFGVK